MTKRFAAIFALILFASAANFLGAANDKPQTWKGVVTLVCTAPPVANSAAAAADACRFTLFTPADKKLYILAPQEGAAKYSKKAVTVTGTLSDAKTKVATADGVADARTIQVAKIAAVPAS